MILDSSSPQSYNPKITTEAAYRTKISAPNEDQLAIILAFCRPAKVEVARP